jgi:hypothetical protein
MMTRWTDFRRLIVLRWLLCSGACALLLFAATEQTAVAQGGPGLEQYWYAGRTNDRQQAEDLFATDSPVVPPFRAEHGTSWWFGHQIEGELTLPDLEDCAAAGLCPPYPVQVADGLGDDTNLPVEGNQSLTNYSVRATGFLLVPQTGTYRFADGIDDYTFWAVDADKSGVAGDNDDEVVIDDNNWTDVDRDRGNLGGSMNEIDLTVAAGGEWLAVEFYMSEGGGHDAGIIYWDYDVANNVVGGAKGFPDDETAPVDQLDIPNLWIPNSHLWSGGPPPTGGGGAPRLEAGDADQDLDFDQLDLVKVQIGGKYLTGQAATWGEGDWNGAPGGSQGNPPPGNSRFDQGDIIAALNANKYLKGKYAALANANGARGDGQTSIIYNAGTGEVAVDAPAGVQLTSVNIDSAGRIFTGAPAQNLGGSFDNDADGNIFKATFGSSFGSLSFGNVAQAGLSQQFVLNDLTVVGSLAGGGALGNVDLIYIPEPSTLVLVGLGLLGLAAARMRRRR